MQSVHGAALIPIRAVTIYQFFQYILQSPVKSFNLTITLRMDWGGMPMVNTMGIPPIQTGKIRLHCQSGEFRETLP